MEAFTRVWHQGALGHSHAVQRLIKVTQAESMLSFTVCKSAHYNDITMRLGTITKRWENDANT